MPISGHRAVSLNAWQHLPPPYEHRGCKSHSLFLQTILHLGNFLNCEHFWFWSSKGRRMYYDVLCKAGNHRASSLHLGTTEIVVLIILDGRRGGVCPIHCRGFSSIAGLYPPVTLPQLVTTKKRLQTWSNVPLGTKSPPAWELWPWTQPSEIYHLKNIPFWRPPSRENFSALAYQHFYAEPAV